METYVILDKYFDGYKLKNECKVFTIINGIIESEAVGDQETIKKITHSGYDVVDLRGKFITPGLVDSHNHFMLTALKLKYQIDFAGVRSIGDFLKVLQENKDKVLHGWFQGYAINEYNMKEKKLPDKSAIDKIFGDIPVFITQMTEHYALCNSKALEIAGITKEMKSPPNGKIDRDPEGMPNGILYEATAMDLVKKMIPEYNVDDYIDAIKFGAREYRNTGISTVKDIGGTGNDVNEETRIMALNKIAGSGEIGIRIALTLPVYSLKDVEKKIRLSKIVKESPEIKFSGFKMFLDGSILSKTAWMKRDYMKSENGSNRGMSLWNINDFKEALKILSATGNHISIHTIGDKAIETALDTIEELKNAGIGSKYALVHCYKLDSETIKKIKNLGVGVETQVSFIYFIGDAITDNIGREESMCLFPVNTLISNNIRVSNGSDSPVTSFNPIYGIYSSIFRKTFTGHNTEIYGGKEKLSIEDALRTYTSESSEVIGWDRIGILKKGGFADFDQWGTDPKDLGNDIKDWINLKINSFSIKD
jgi:predicted amidohydrolase YtcJ